VTLSLFAHPFSSYSQKVLIALWELDLPFTYRHLEEGDAGADMAALWPFGQFPVLVDDDTTVAESSIIIEHLQLNHGGRISLIPADPKAALEVRMMDRFFDLFVMAEMQKPVFELVRTDGTRLDAVKTKAGEALDTAYRWLEGRLAGKTWATGDDFTLADCAAAPSLFYADWVHPIGPDFPTVRAYRARLLARPTIARAVNEGRPYRHYFPLGAPDRD
jgi:glutathione S-transferase